MTARSLKYVKWDAGLVAIGFAAGEIEKIRVNRYSLKNVSVSGLFWRMYGEKDSQGVVEDWIRCWN